MRLVHGLPAHAEKVSDLLPGPPVFARVGDLQNLEPVDQLSQRSHGSEADGGIRAARLFR